MRRAFQKIFILFSLAGALGGCASGTPSADSATGSRMTAVEAREFIAKVQAERGMKPAQPVASVEELLAVIEADEVNRFESASRLVAGKPGIDAQVLYVSVELLWSDAFSTIARLADELGRRADVEVQRLTQLRDSGRKLTEQEEQALERAKQDVAFDLQASEALDVLAVEHLRSTVTIVNELLRQYPDDDRAYRVAALYYLLAGDWDHFDKAMGWLKSKEAEDAGLQYIRAMEAYKRFAIRKEASAFLKQALKLNPKLVRAQAKLVLAEEGIEAKHAELQGLKALAPAHPIVNLLGPSITSEYEMSVAIAKARGAQAPAAAPASSGAPVAAPAPAQP
jgi:tetratricopeptide (TPR) repeat protein